MFKYAVLTLLLLLATTACSQVYKDREFGFKIIIPNATTPCVSEPYQHNTGILLYLDGGSADCHEKDTRRYIATIGSYNSEDWPDATALIKGICIADKAVITYMEPTLTIAGLPIKMCKMELIDGRVQIISATQRLIKQSAERDAPLIEINYMIYLQTDYSNFENDYMLYLDAIKTTKILN